MSNYPDGMRESDLPGHYDVECPECTEGEPEEGCQWCDGTGIADSRDLDGDYYYDDSERDDDEIPSRWYDNDWA